MRKALHLAGVKPVVVPDGWDPIHYTDEIVVQDHSECGSGFFIIKRKEIKKWLSYLPPLREEKKHS